MRLAIVQTVLLAAVSPFALAQSIDTLNPLPESGPTTLAIQADGKILIGGSFLQIGTTPMQRVARLNRDGSLDTSFSDPMVDNVVQAIAVQADGKILIAGDFTTIGTATRHYLARLNADGSLDGSFADPGFGAEVWALAVQPDGNILAAGDFTAVGGTTRNYLARISATGTLDGSFADPQLNNSTRSVALQADGHVLVGGFFTHVGAQTQFYFARFSSTGVFDTTFPVASNLIPGSIVVAPNASIYISEPSAASIIKLTATGAIDGTYASTQTDAAIDSFELQPNGKIVASGIFENVGGQPRHALARLNADGTLDTSFADLNFSFNATNPNGYIYAIAAQTDGNIVVSGNFTFADNLSRSYMARVVTGDAIVNTLTGTASGGNTIATWTRSGGGAELPLPPVLLYSTDGVNYATVGTMTRIANGWQYTAPYNVAGAPFYLQATAITSGGANNGSPGRINSPIYVSDRIFANGFESN
ncbi:MAG: delta-60 repeat domain-containing protein [Proteobacteria bacterium]|nr:delta-60 repeat domain-containing protein [Pseudomonadota bacterium]